MCQLQYLTFVDMIILTMMTIGHVDYDDPAHHVIQGDFFNWYPPKSSKCQNTL